MSDVQSAEALLATTDWAATPLGPRAEWPRSLSLITQVVLLCRLPMYLLWGPDRIQIYNDAYVPILGRKHPAAMGRPARETWPDAWAVVSPMWDRVEQGESIGINDFAITLERHGEPEQLVFDFSYSPVPDDDGQVGGILVTFVDTTERVAMQARLLAKAERLRRLGEELEARQRQLAAVVDSVPAGVITVDRAFEIVLFNHAAEQMFGVPAAEVLGRSVDLLLPERFRPQHAAQMQGYAEGQGDAKAHAVDRELTGRRWNGEEFPVEASLARTRIHGELLMTAVLRDLTEAHELRREKLARAAAEEASEAKSRFLSQLSHELRTPLNAVLGFAQLLEFSDASAEPQRVREYATLILAAGRHQLAMIDDLLDLSRIEENGLTVTPAPVPVAPLLRECLDMVAARAQARGVQLDRTPAAVGDVVAWADPVRLRQIVLNLLSNAVKYNRPGGRVAVSCVRTAEGPVDLSVRDDGPGIPAHLQGRLFTPFERLSQTNGPIEGAGLGLALSRRLARAMGGDVRLHSVEGRGTTATVTVPAA